MKKPILVFFLFLNLVVFGQLPEMVIDSAIFKNTLRIDYHTLTDTNSAEYTEGHLILGTHRYISYNTMLFNAGDTVGNYGNPRTDTANWEIDESHGHYHYKNGIQVILYRWNGNSWDSIHHNKKLDYDLVNQQKYPAGYNRYFIDFLVWGHTYYENSRFTHWFDIDSSLAKYSNEYPAHPDTFYTYPTEDYNSGNRGILPYFGDEYTGNTPGNWNLIPDSVDGIYRIKAWHKPPFEEKHNFNDTVDITFAIIGNTIIHDTFPTIITCEDTIPETITLLGDYKGNTFYGTREIVITGAIITADCPAILNRYWIRGNNVVSNSAVPIKIFANTFIDQQAPKGDYIYKCNGVSSIKVRYK